MTKDDKSLIAILVIGGILFFVPMLAWGVWSLRTRGMMGGWGMMGRGGMMVYGGGPMILLSVVFIILLVAGVYLFLPGLGKPWSQVPRSENRSLEILKERYAKGEITREEYLRMKEEI